MTMNMADEIRRLLANAFQSHVARDHDRFVIGKVSSVDATNFRLDVKLGGDAVATTNVRYLKTYSPSVNDYVIVVIMSSRNYLVLGNVNAIA